MTAFNVEKHILPDGTTIETWEDPTYIDPSDLSAVDAFEVITPIYRPFILRIDKNVQAFPTQEQRAKYLQWWLSLRAADAANTGLQAAIESLYTACAAATVAIDAFNEAVEALRKGDR